MIPVKPVLTRALTLGETALGGLAVMIKVYKYCPIAHVIAHTSLLVVAPARVLNSIRVAVKHTKPDLRAGFGGSNSVH